MKRGETHAELKRTEEEPETQDERKLKTRRMQRLQAEKREARVSHKEVINTPCQESEGRRRQEASKETTSELRNAGEQPH